MTVKTNLGLVAWALQWVGQRYWYGTCCYDCTTSLLNRKTHQYPSHYTSSRMAQYKADVATGKKCCDCVGLIKGFYWTKDDGTQVYGLDGRPDKGANGMFNTAKVKGSISTLPEVPGLLLYSPGHVGVYIGGGYAVEARGFNYGVVKTKVSQRGWTHWYQCPYIDYIPSQSTDPANTDDPQTPTNGENLSLAFGTRLLRYKTGRKMASGDDVLAVQKRLYDLGFDPGKPDGLYGPKTAAAVTSFQESRSIEADGLVGSETRGELSKS